MIISVIAALSENRVIGRDNRLPWRLSVDLKRFRKLTTGHPIILGRRTFDSIGKPLPNRTNIVITRQTEWAHPGVQVAHSLGEAIEIARGFEGSDEVFVIGGAEIYLQALPLCGRIYLTVIHSHVEGDAFFPPFGRDEFQEVGRDRGIEGEWEYSFVDLARVK